MKPCIIILVALLGATAPRLSAGDLPPNHFHIEVEQALKSPEQATLYSIEPGETSNKEDDYMQGHKILGKVPLNKINTPVAVGAFQNAVARGQGDSTAMCFNPRHALRILSGGHTYDLLLCYQCKGLVVYKDNEVYQSLAVDGTSAVLNTLLAPVIVRRAMAGSSAAADAQEKKLEEERARWLAAIPASLRKLWPDEDWMADKAEFVKVRAALVREYPDTEKRCLVLFGWFGSGTDTWIRHPAYEAVPESLLLEVPTALLVSAAQRSGLSEAQEEGAARFFSGMQFPTKRPADLKALPPDLKKKLLAHSLKSSDPDKISRARQVFE